MKENKKIFSLEERKKIGQRIRSARLTTNLSRSDFCNRHNISPSTLFSLEVGRINFTENKMHQLLTAFNFESVVCTSQWLLEGKGLPPYSFDGQKFDQDTLCKNDTDAFSIFREIEVFKQGSDQAFVILVQDDAMMPLYKPGDYVGGKIVFEQEILNFIGKICLIETDKKEFIIRHLFQEDNYFILSGINPQSKICSPLLKIDSVRRIARILWHRQPY